MRKPHFFAACSSLTLAAVCGCAHQVALDPMEPKAPVPAAWFGPGVATAAAPAPTALAQWWQRLHDPQLTHLVTRALQTNTDVRSARATLAQARAQRDLQAGALGPSVVATASAQHGRVGNSGASSSFAAGLDASWESDLFGGRRNALAASLADAQAAFSTLGQVQVTIAAEVALNYIELRGLQARLDIAYDNLASQDDTLHIARWRAQAGLASSLDLEQAVAANEQTRAQIPTLQTSLAQAFHALAVLLHQPPGSLQASLEPAPVPLPPDDLTLALPAATLRQRADVSAAEYRIRAALQRVAQADAARYPSPQISGSIGLRALTLATLPSGASVTNSLLASVVVPLFDGGAALAQVRIQDAALEQARLSYRSTVLRALQEVEDGLISLRGNRERLARLQSGAEAAAHADLLARQRYASGLIDFRSVLDTQRTLLSLQDAVASTRASLSADHVRLYKALGGGWTPDA